MEISDIADLVRLGESETLELKKSTSELREGMQSLCGMANRHGGTVIFGVLPTANRPIEERLRGQDVSEKTLEEIAKEIRKFEPPISPDIAQVRLDSGKQIIVITIPKGDGPYVYDGRPYKKTAATKGVMPQADYDRLLAERRNPNSRWEIQPAEGVTIQDLDENEIIITVEEAIRRGRLADPATRDPARLLRGLGLMADEKLTNAAVALFAREEVLPMRYPQCVLRLARFVGNDKSEFLDSRQEFGNAFVLLKRALIFIKEHIPVAGRIVPGLFERQDDPLYPPEALREALANAIIHRDYSIGGGSISLAIYQDRLEITSVGPLPFGQKVEELLQPHSSKPWNPSMARVFYLRGLIETWGRGTIKIMELTERAGLSRPEIISSKNDVTVRFFPLGYVAPADVRHNLSDLQRLILETIARNDGQSLSEILEGLGNEYPRRTIQDNLKLLRTLGLVKVEGKRKWTKWKIS